MRNLISVYFCLLSLVVHAQENVSIQGRVTDQETGEILAGVNVSVFAPDHNKGAITDENGRYTLQLPKGTYQITFAFLGYQEVTKTIQIPEEKKLNISLAPSSESLHEVLITNHSTTESLRSAQMSVAAIKPESVKKLPTVLGEVDVVKSLLLLPGISSGGELSTGFNVRGGSADQNLILLDNATLYKDRKSVV